MERLDWALAFVALFCALASPAFALNASLVNPGGTPLALQYDTESQSYADTGVNPDALIRFCNVGGLESFYTGLVYKVGDSYELVSTPLGSGFGDLIYFPGTGSTCGDANIQISSFRAYYPAWPMAVVSGDAFLSPDDTFLPLSNTTGWMSGSYRITRSVSGRNVTIDVYEARTGTGASIPVDKTYLVVGIRNSTGDIIDSGITSINDSILLDRGSSTETPDVVVNGIGTQPSVTPTPPRPPPPEPPTGCVIDDQCPDTYYCTGGACEPVPCACGSVTSHICHSYACCNSTDCASGQRCVNHACVQPIATPTPSGGCFSDGDCPTGFVCVSGLCTLVPECTSDINCPPGFTCANGTCSPAPPECASDSDCMQGFICVNGQCAQVPPQCSNDVDCPDGYVCQDGRCAIAPPECQADSDCAPGTNCVSGHCRAALQLSAPPTAEINSQFNVTVFYFGDIPASGASVEITLPSGKKVVATADMDGIATFRPDETGLVRIVARKGGDTARGQTRILPMAFIGTIVGFTIDCGNAWLYILLIAGLCSLLAWWLVHSRLEGEKKYMSEEQLRPFSEKQRLVLWGSWLLVSAMLFLLPLLASLFVNPCVLVQYMPLEVLLIIALEIVFIVYDKLREKDRKAGMAQPEAKAEAQKPSEGQKMEPVEAKEEAAPEEEEVGGES